MFIRIEFPLYISCPVTSSTVRTRRAGRQRTPVLSQNNLQSSCRCAAEYGGDENVIILSGSSGSGPQNRGTHFCSSLQSSRVSLVSSSPLFLLLLHGLSYTLLSIILLICVSFCFFFCWCCCYVSRALCLYNNITILRVSLNYCSVLLIYLFRYTISWRNSS